MNDEYDYDTGVWPLGFRVHNKELLGGGIIGSVGRIG